MNRRTFVLRLVSAAGSGSIAGGLTLGYNASNREKQIQNAVDSGIPLAEAEDKQRTAGTKRAFGSAAIGALAGFITGPWIFSDFIEKDNPSHDIS
jgi:hypothetical protein